MSIIKKKIFVYISAVFVSLFCVQITYAQNYNATQHAIAFQKGVDSYNIGRYQEAFDFWYPLAQSGDAMAARNVGHLFHEGYGVQKDVPEALKWYEQAAKKGVVSAQLNAGIIYLEGKDKVRRDLKKAYTFFYDAATKGNPVAQYNLGVMYEEGFGVQQDLKKALSWYYNAASAGHNKAAAKMGILVKNTPDFQSSEIKPDKISEINPDQSRSFLPAKEDLANITNEVGRRNINISSNDIDIKKKEESEKKNLKPSETKTLAITEDKIKTQNQLIAFQKQQTLKEAEPLERLVKNYDNSPDDTVKVKPQVTKISEEKIVQKIMPKQDLLTKAEKEKKKITNLEILCKNLEKKPKQDLTQDDQNTLSECKRLTIRQNIAEKSAIIAFDKEYQKNARIDIDDERQDDENKKTIFKNEITTQKITDATPVIVNPYDSKEPLLQADNRMSIKDVSVDDVKEKQKDMTSKVAEKIQHKIENTIEKSEGTQTVKQDDVVTQKQFETLEEKVIAKKTIPVKTASIDPRPLPTPSSAHSDAMQAYRESKFTNALKIWNSLAAKGDADAYYWLGKLYNKGQGVQRSTLMAYKYWRLAAYAGHQQAVTAFENLQARMSDDEIKSYELKLM